MNDVDIARFHKINKKERETERNVIDPKKSQKKVIDEHGRNN